MTAQDSRSVLELTYSVDELAVIADLLGVERIPGSPDPDSVTAEAKGAAARALVARGVLEIVDSDAVEIRQPHATVLSLVCDGSDRAAMAVSGGLCRIRVPLDGPER